MDAKRLDNEALKAEGEKWPVTLSPYHQQKEKIDNDIRQIRDRAILLERATWPKIHVEKVIQYIL